MISNFVSFKETGHKCVITVPHDGRIVLENLPKRSCPLSVTKRDINTWPIGRDVAELSAANIVYGNLSRKVVDYNRPLCLPDRFGERAVDSPNRAVVTSYATYHQIIQSLCFPGSLILDIHGFGDNSPYGEYDIVLGSMGGKTVHNNEDLELKENLEASGYKVLIVEHEQEPLFGRYTIAHHSQNGASGIQIEIGPKFRMRRKGLKGYGTRLATDLAHFIETT